MPTPAEREQLWDRFFPQYAPRAQDLDIPYLAKQFNLAGGSIMNAAINACIVAAAEQKDVGMKHAIESVARELYKMGKQVNRVHFGDYYDWVAEMF
jgi:hypothetical protein